MALTKVTGDFIKAGSITQGHLHSSHGITTSHVGEGSNLYFTNARVDSRIGDLSTSNLSEGTNLYYTDARADARIALQVGSNLDLSNKSTSDLSEGTNLYYTQARFNTAFTAKSTSDLSEGTNLYYTDARARGAISVSGNALSYNSSTGVITSNFEESPTFSGNVVINGSGSSGNAFYVSRGSDSSAAFRVTNSGEVVTNANYFYAAASGVSMYVQNTAVFRGAIMNDQSNAAVRIGDALTIDDNLTVTGGDITLGGTGRIQGIDTVSANTDAANKLYVDNQVAGIVDSAPSTLDTLNELAAALGDDANFSTTVTNSIATKLPLAGGNMTGAINFDQTNSSGGGDFDFIIMGYNGSWSNNQNGLASIAVNDGTGIVGRYGITYGSGGGRFVVTDLYDGGYGASGDILTIAGNGATNLNGSFAATGNVTGANLNISNWDTAYGWGNHASAGYLTSFDITTQTDSKYLRSNAEDTTTGSLIVDNDWSSGTYSDSLTIYGTYPSFSLRSTNSNSNTGSTFLFHTDSAGDIQYYFSTTGINENWTKRFSFYTNGRFDALTQIRTPILYDSADTGYYIDPASTSNVNQFNVYSTARLINGGSGMASHAALNIGFTSSGETRAIDMDGSWSSGESKSITATHGTASTNIVGQLNFQHNNPGSKIRWGKLYHGGDSSTYHMELISESTSTAYLTVNGSMRAPIFYDKDNTAFYVDPSNGANGISANLQGRIQVGTFSHSQTNTGEAWIGRASDRAAGVLTVQLGTGTGRKFEVVDYGWNTVEFSADDSGVATANSSFRAPIFYDSNDTNHYLDPASTSVVNTLQFSGSSNNGRFDADEWGVRFKTDAGYILFGPANTSHAHIYTDRDNFYFNKQIILNGGSTINTADIRAGIFYDINNTAYYTNPNSQSSLWGVAIRGDNGTTSTDNQIFFYGAGNTTTSAIGFKANGGNFANPTGNGDGWNTYLTMDTSGRGWVFRRGTGGNNFTSAYTSGWILNNGVWQANASMRSPIFYDSNDTTYYTNPASTSNMFQGYYKGKTDGWSLQLGDSDITRVYDDDARASLVINAAYYPHLYINANSNNSNSNHGSVFSMTGNISGGFRRWSMGWPNYNPTVFSMGSYDNQDNPHYGCGGGLGVTTWGSRYWFDTSGNGQAHTSWRAPIFYDSNNTSYYVNPDSTTSLRTVGSWRSNSSTWDGEFAGKMQYHSNWWYIQTTNGVFIRNASGANNITLSAAGTGTANNDWRAPIFYDLNNTGYYTDPASTSNVNAMTFAGVADFNGGHGGVNITNTSILSSASSTWTGNPGGAGKIQYHSNRWYIVSDSSSNRIVQFRRDGSDKCYIDNDGRLMDVYDVRAYEYYDRNDTSYYLNPNSTSNLNAATFAGNVIGQNAYFGQDVGIGFTSGNIGGNLNIKNSAAGQIAAKIELGSSSNGSTIGAFIHTGASYASSGMFLNFQSNHISGDDNVLICYLDGDLVNKNNSYTQYSDERLKENIVDATPKLNEIKQIKVRNFNFKGEDLKQIGVVAQELEPIFPALVKEREVPGHDDPVKTVKYSVMVPILIKAMQEQQTIIDDLKSRLETLENQ